MTGPMQAVTSFELEGVRRQEVLLAGDPSDGRTRTALADVAHAPRRVGGRLAAAGSALIALVATGGSPATGSQRT